MDVYIEDFLVYKNFGTMPYKGGTEEQPYEWVEAMMAIQLALNKVEVEEDAEQRAREEKSNKGSGKQRFVG